MRQVRGSRGVAVKPRAVVVPTPGARKRVGRPRPPATDRVILGATVSLLVEGGLRAATVNAIADRSRCAKTTIYRRWPSRDALILDAMRAAVQGTTEHLAEVRQLDRELGSTVRGAARNISALVQSPLFRATFPVIARELFGNTSLGKKFRAEVFQPIRAQVRDRLRDEVTRGTIRPDADLDLILDLVNGAILYRALLGESVGEATADEVAQLIATGSQPG